MKFAGCDEVSKVLKFIRERAQSKKYFWRPDLPRQPRHQARDHAIPQLLLASASTLIAAVILNS
jgi:hypothetical protein